MRRLVVLACVALAGCQSDPTRFDLVCRGPWSEEGRPEVDRTVRLSVDLGSQTWCYIDECNEATLSRIEAVTSQYYLFANNVRLDRNEGTIRSFWQGGEFNGTCTPARFTRPPKATLREPSKTDRSDT
ncbi:MAG: hypothetical protein DCF28_09570 [Alphaproteobacteria bacterium]|nr:MAG: hypothetical protein DCF28_09570 [Alphaproteobacteria bacterium]